MERGRAITTRADGFPILLADIPYASFAGTDRNYITVERTKRLRWRVCNIQVFPLSFFLFPFPTYNTAFNPRTRRFGEPV